LAKWIKENYSVDYVDTITEPGVDKTITENSVFESIKTKVSISINAHKSELIVLSGHYDCAANQVSNEEHIELIKKGIGVISSWNLGAKVFLECQYYLIAIQFILTHRILGYMQDFRMIFEHNE